MNGNEWLEPMRKAAEMRERPREGILGHWQESLTMAFDPLIPLGVPVPADPVRPRSAAIERRPFYAEAGSVNNATAGYGRYGRVRVCSGLTAPANALLLARI
jgi:hypothetical protein